MRWFDVVVAAFWMDSWAVVMEVLMDSVMWVWRTEVYLLVVVSYL
jgi:hypothetical protein